MRTARTPRRPLEWRGQPEGARRLWLIIVTGLFTLGVLALAACGGSFTSIQPTQPVTQVTATGPAQQAQYAYLYSRVDYPLQVPVNAGDTVTLTLSPQSNILTVTPSPGSGSQTIGAPIPLPTDLSLYQDIGAEADTVDTAQSPVVWQLQSAPRQSLLTPTGASPRQYLPSVAFRWHVQATAAGENTINIVLRLYYVYLDGSEHDGTIQVTQQPIPILAVQPSPISNSLPSLKLPLAGATWLAGFIAALRFIWKAFQTINNVTEPVKQAAEVAVAVKKHIGGSEKPEQQPQQPASQRGYPNPWAQSGTWQPQESGTPPPPLPDATQPNGRPRPLPPPAPPPGPPSSWPPRQ